MTHGKATFDLPVLYHRDDAFALYFAAKYEKVKAVMPSDKLYPVILPGRKAVVVIGAFNMAGDGVVKLSEAGAMIGKRTQKIPRRLYSALIRLLWQLHVRIVEAPAAIVDHTSYSWVLDTVRAKNKMGWHPRYTSRETLRIMLETHDYNLVRDP